jgi:hypothetical protein
MQVLKGCARKADVAIMEASVSRSHLPPVHYDRAQRRLWILGQRCHHGATGAMLAGVAASGLAAARLTARSGLALTATATLLMAHDWKDRSMWFQLGHGNQP